MANQKVVTGDEYVEVHRKIREIERQLLQKNGYPFSLYQLNNLLQNAVIGRFDTSIDPRFELIGEFSMTIPEDYKPKEQLTDFAKKYKKFFRYSNDDISDKNFPNPTHELIPGKTYKVKKFGIRKRVISEDIMNLLKSQNAYLTGAQGASMTYQLKKDELLKGKFYVFFDEKDKLLAEFYGDHRVPYLDHDADGSFGYRLGSFGRNWGEDGVVLCFCD